LNTGTEAKNIQNDINILASKKLTVPNIYVVKDIKIPRGIQRIYYKDLRNFDGRSLPKFTHTPFINVPSNYSIGVAMYVNNKDYFEFEVASTLAGSTDSFDMWILTNE
jgi:hypothetical protein